MVRDANERPPSPEAAFIGHYVMDVLSGPKTMIHTSCQPRFSQQAPTDAGALDGEHNHPIDTGTPRRVARFATARPVTP
ncbi:hypothetical protein [Candidatus Poriferisodalis sp.]|uniref:hypothetical protein n=1 Tax=Candidatus Poriferisodalis sp. TaxID=3101277 RepID=UPI003B020A64